MSPRQIAKTLAGFGVVAVAVLLIATIWIVRHRSAGQVAQSTAGLVPGTLLRAHNFHWTQMKAGERQWVLSAGEADYSADKTDLKLTDAVVTMDSSDGKTVVINAPHADLTMNGNHVSRAYLTGGAIFHFGDYVLTTDSATFLPDDDKVDAPGQVTLEGNGLKVTGVGLTGHPKTRVFQLQTQTETVVTPKKDSEKPKQS